MSEIDIRIENGVGHITLNRPRALNALTLGMVEAIDAALVAWADQPDLRVVLLDGAGERGLCAGGDIRAIYDALLQDDMDLPARFFRAEYRMNARIARFPKPIVALMDGITMGGGIGVSAHGAIRIVTERSRLAMPETGIGFVPDVGGTHLLSRAPDELGTHAALTALQFGAADALLLGIADIFVPAERLPALAKAILGGGVAARNLADFRDYAESPPPGILAGARHWIPRCYSGNSVDSIQAALQAAPEEAAHKALSDMAGKSPTSLKITLRALREARAAPSIEDTLEREFRLAMSCMERPDFREGVRAALVDKDRSPKWSPARLQDVSEETVNAMEANTRHGNLGLLA